MWLGIEDNPLLVAGKLEKLWRWERRHALRFNRFLKISRILVCYQQWYQQWWWCKGISISIFLENTTELDWMLVSNVFQIFTQIPEEMIQFDLYFEEGLKPPLVKALKMIKCSKKLCPVCSLCYSNGLKQPTRWSLWDTKQIKFLLWKHAKTAERPVFEGPFYPFFLWTCAKKKTKTQKNATSSNFFWLVAGWNDLL